MKKQIKTLYLLSKLKHEVEIADANWDIYWVYKNRRDRPKYVHVLNEYPSFFHTSLATHYNQVVISLGKIFDNVENTINVKRLIKEGVLQGFIDKKLEKEIDKKLKTFWPVIQKLIIIRGNAIAHLNLHLTHEETFKKANVTYREFNKLIHLGYWILEKVYPAFRNEPFHERKLFSAIEDTRRVLTSLKSSM